MSLPSHLACLAAIDQPSQEHDYQLQNAHSGQHACKPSQFSLSGAIFLGSLLAPSLCAVVSRCGASLGFRCSRRLRKRRRRLCGRGLIAISMFGVGGALSTIGFGSPLVALAVGRRGSQSRGQEAISWRHNCNEHAAILDARTTMSRSKSLAQLYGEIFCRNTKIVDSLSIIDRLMSAVLTRKGQLDSNCFCHS
jgi:hypothetical protein